MVCTGCTFFLAGTSKKGGETANFAISDGKYNLINLRQQFLLDVCNVVPYKKLILYSIKGCKVWGENGTFWELVSHRRRPRSLNRKSSEEF